MKNFKKTWVIITLILAGEAIFLLPFVLMRVFRPIIRKAFEITDFEIGKAQAIYGVTAMASYVFGGYLADKWDAKKLISISLVLTAFGGVFMLSSPSFETLQWLYGFWGVSTILLFWAALIKATRLWGNSNNQGLSFGLLDGGRGVFAALIATFGALIPTLIFPENTSEITEEDITKTMQYIIGFVIIVVLLTAFLIWMVLPKSLDNENYSINFKKVIVTLIKPKVFFHALIIVCAYSMCKVTDVFSIYAEDVWGYGLSEASNFGVFIQWLRPVAAISLGWLADKVLASKMILVCFTLALISSFFIGFGILESLPVLVSVLTFVLMVIGIYAMRGLYFALIEDANTPLLVTGTVVGIISLIGYTPDVFMSLLSGAVLGENPTVINYQKLFKIVMVLPIVGLVATILFRFYIKKEER